MRPAPICQSALRIPQDQGVESNVVLWQQEIARAILVPPLQDKAQRIMRQHSAEPQGSKNTLTGKFTYLHVYGHMDRYLLWHQLSLPQQLNCIRDMLAKHTMTLATMEGPYNRPTQLLPREDVAVVLGETKSPTTFPIPSDFKQARKRPGSIWKI
jgi:hypothetical protein